jgi:signal transduction histidine kinase
VVVAHGGQIWVEPGPGGVGSRFAFTLPLPEETNS